MDSITEKKVEELTTIPFSGNGKKEEKLYPPGWHYFEGWISREEEEALWAEIHARPWSKEITRATQHYSYRYDYRTKKVTAVDDAHREFPPLCRAVIDRIGSVFALPAGWKWDQLIVNRYRPHEGIAPHIDRTDCFGAVIACISLGEACTLDLALPHKGLRHSPLISPRSLYILSEAARYSWTHGISCKKTTSRTYSRVSLTARMVLPHARPSPPIASANVCAEHILHPTTREAKTSAPRKRTLDTEVPEPRKRETTEAAKAVKAVQVESASPSLQLQERKGEDIWNTACDWICVTTNGIVKSTGQLVMGRGIALDAVRKIPGCADRLGADVKRTGNHVYFCGTFEGKKVWSFPTKHDYRHASDLALIDQSCRELLKVWRQSCELLESKSEEKEGKEEKHPLTATTRPIVALPKVGCLNGGLDYASQVKPLLMKHFGQPDLSPFFVICT